MNNARVTRLPADKKTFKLGLTGSIATGKTTVLNLFEEMGHPGFSADDCVHHLYQKEALPIIQKWFPRAITNNHIDRQTLARHVLSHPARLEKLEKLVHPLVEEKIAQFVNQQQVLARPLVVIEVPLLFENNTACHYDAVAVTTCSIQDQHERALGRADMNENKLQNILARQMPQDEKIERADYVIDTSRPIASLTLQLQNIVCNILN